jgi:hypothetical protein
MTYEIANGKACGLGRAGHTYTWRGNCNTHSGTSQEIEAEHMRDSQDTEKTPGGAHATIATRTLLTWFVWPAARPRAMARANILDSDLKERLETTTLGSASQLISERRVDRRRRRSSWPPAAADSL